MNVAALQAMHATPAVELASELQGACAGIAAAATTVQASVSRNDRAALDQLERLAERGSGIARLAMLTRSALQRDLARETDPPRAA